MYRAILLFAVLVGCRGVDPPAEHYGFVARLGRDTVSVERVTRGARSLVSDDVDRFPLVRIRHTEISLAPDGRLTKMVMDVRTPNGATPARRARRITARFTDESVYVTVHDSSGDKERTFATGGALTVPHISMLYSVIELEIASAMRQGKARNLAPGDSVMFRQFYPDRDVGPSFVLHRGWVHPVGGGKVELWHDWLAGVGDVTVDTSGRMLTYLGMRSTYKVAVTRTTELPDVEAIGARFAATEKQAGASELSVRDTARATIGAAVIAIDYGRPLARGRTLLGQVIDYDRVWRTGANAATQLTVSAPITLGTLALKPGTYTLWTVPRTSGVELIVNSEHGQWGTEYDRGLDIGTTPLQSETVTAPVEKFTISIAPRDATHGMLVLEWGTFRWTAPIVVR